MLDSTICNAFPYDETMLLWVTAKGESGATYYIVSDQFRKEYFLFKGKKKMKWESDNPLSLYAHMK